MPIIDPGTEEPTRGMLGHAIRGETQELAALIQSVGGERYRQALSLCVIAAAYVAVDVAGRWPTDADVREIARLLSESGAEIPLDEADVYDYLSGAALGFRPLPQVMGDDMAAATLPLFITGTLLFAYRPEGSKWWDYLDQIWEAYEKAEALDVSVLPALQVRARRIKAAREHDGAADLVLHAINHERGAIRSGGHAGLGFVARWAVAHGAACPETRLLLAAASAHVPAVRHHCRSLHDGQQRDGKSTDLRCSLCKSRIRDTFSPGAETLTTGTAVRESAPFPEEAIRPGAPPCAREGRGTGLVPTAVPHNPTRWSFASGGTHTGPPATRGPFRRRR
jgi:hypothetical protein